MNKQIISVSSEIGPLEKVIIHRPDSGIDRISPRRAEDLLFDDIVYLPQMQKEHDIFAEVLKALIGKDNVLETEQLLLESLATNDSQKEELLHKIVAYEELPKSLVQVLMDKPDEELTEILITGYDTKGDFILFEILITGYDIKQDKIPLGIITSN